MKKRKRIGVFLLGICMLAALMPREAFAASAKVSVSGASGTVGSTVTVTCTASISGADIGGADVVLEYDPSGLTVMSCSSGASGGAGSVYFSQNATNAGQSSLSFTVSFKILKEGTHSISVPEGEVFDWESGASVSTSKSGGSVTGKAATTSNNGGGSTSNNNNSNNINTNIPADNKDSNSKLSSLQVSPGTLSPAFAADTTSYTVTVPETTTEVTIAATAQSNKATVSVSGGKDLKLGKNEAKVVVTAENGSTTVYNLTILCGEKESISIDGADHTINEEFTDEQIPTGFVRDKVSYNGREYEALKHEKGDLYLVSLKKDEAGDEFYIYDPKTQEFYHYVQIGFIEGRYIIPLPLDDNEEFADCDMIPVTLQEKQFDAWKLDEEYSVIRVMNSDGEITFYQYDSLDGTLQRYAGPVAEETIEETKEPEMTFLSFLEDYSLYIMTGLAAFSLILMIALIYFIATRKHRHQKRKMKMQKKLEKQKEKESLEASER